MNASAQPCPNVGVSRLYLPVYMLLLQRINSIQVHDRGGSAEQGIYFNMRLLFTCWINRFPFVYSFQMRAFDARPSARRMPWAAKTVWSFGVNATIHFIIVACRCGWNRTIVARFANKNGPFNEWASEQPSRTPKPKPTPTPTENIANEIVLINNQLRC